MLELVRRRQAQKVEPADMLDYTIFRERHRPAGPCNELEVFERFHAARHLVQEGFETFLDADVRDSSDGTIIRADACGAKNDLITMVFCQTGKTNSSLLDRLEKIRKCSNAHAIVLAPHISDFRTLEDMAPNLFKGGNISFETLGWFSDKFDDAFRQTLRLIDILGNETRMRMMAPLFRSATAKKDYRSTINPKLVYQNLSVLQGSGLLDEVREGCYELSQLGRTIMAEFITFLEKTRRTLETASREREVSVNG